MEASFTVQNDRYFSRCLACGRRVEGFEERGYGSEKIVRFRCSCRSSWFKRRDAVVRAANRGFRNGHGQWVPCDAQGRITDQALTQIQEESSLYAGQVTAPSFVTIAHKWLTEGRIDPDQKSPVSAAMRVLQRGGTDEEARQAAAAVTTARLRSQHQQRCRRPTTIRW